MLRCSRDSLRRVEDRRFGWLLAKKFDVPSLAAPELSLFFPQGTDIKRPPEHVRNVAQESGRSSSVSLLLAAIEPGKAYPRPAAAIVHYLQLQADALLPHLVSFSVVDGVVSGCPLVKTN
jgi:hypothetical protein